MLGPLPQIPTGSCRLRETSGECRRTCITRVNIAYPDSRKSLLRLHLVRDLARIVSPTEGGLSHLHPIVGTTDQYRSKAHLHAALLLAGLVGTHAEMKLLCVRGIASSRA